MARRYKTPSVARARRSLALGIAGLCALGLGASAQANTFALEQIWAAESGDWNADGSVDAALILGPEQGGDNAGLALFLSDPETGRLELDTWLPGLLWGNRAMFGQEPQLVLDDFGRLVVVTRNTAIGRGRWEQTLTLSWRQAWQVDGFSYDYYDTLDMDQQGRCDLDFTTQTAQIIRGQDQDIQSVELAAAPPPELADWHQAFAFSVCGLSGD